MSGCFDAAVFHVQDDQAAQFGEEEEVAGVESLGILNFKNGEEVNVARVRLHGLDASG